MGASKPFQLPNPIVAIFMTVAVVMFAVAAVSSVDAGRALARERTAPGTVVDFAIRQATDGTLYYRPVVTFIAADGSRRTLQLAEESTDPAYQMDEAVTIAYDPAQPEKARIKSPASTLLLWVLPLVTGILAAAFAAATLFARAILRPEPARRR